MTRKLLKIALVVLLSVVSISIDAQEKPVLWYDKPARYWEEALPLGNGRLGAMVYGNPVTEEIQLNEETVSAGSPYKNYNPEAKGALATIRQLILLIDILKLKRWQVKKSSPRTVSGCHIRQWAACVWTFLVMKIIQTSVVNWIWKSCSHDCLYCKWSRL